MNDRPEEKERLTGPVETGTSGEDRAAGWAPPTSGVKTTIILAGVILAGLLVILYAWRLPPFTRTIQTTDNAHVRAHVTIIAPQVDGHVAEVLVRDFQVVKAGDPLAILDSRTHDQRVGQARAEVQAAVASLRNSEQNQRSGTASVAGAEAGLASAEARLAQAEADLLRVNDLVRRGSVSLRERDQTQAAMKQAEAAVAQARAQQAMAEEEVRAVSVSRGGLLAAVENARAALRLAEIDLANTVIRAPRDGAVSEVGVSVGQYVAAGTRLMFLVAPDRWVVANFKEAQTARIAPGQVATVRVDALDGAALRGRVESIAPATASEFSLVRPGGATGNFVKVAQRIAVRIDLDPDQPLMARLRSGMSVEARVDTSTTPPAPDTPETVAGEAPE